MLQLLRQFRRPFAGTLGVLIGSAWLMLAIAPCAAAMDAEMADHCPHCAEMEQPCATVEETGCDLPPALTPAQDFKLKQPALIEHLDVAIAAGPGGCVERMPAAAATGPPHPPFTRLFCRYQE